MVLLFHFVHFYFVTTLMATPPNPTFNTNNPNRMFKTDLGLVESYKKLVREEGAAFMTR